MLRRLKTIYRKLNSAGSLAAGISQHDEQLAKLTVAVAELMNDPRSEPRTARGCAKKPREPCFSIRPRQRTRPTICARSTSSTAVRLAAAESEIADLKSKIGRMESSLNGKGSDGK